METDNIKNLYTQCLLGKATPGEQDELLAWMQDPGNEAQVRELLQQSFFDPKELDQVPASVSKTILAAIFKWGKE